MMHDRSGNILIRKRGSVIRFDPNSGFKKKDSTFMKQGFEAFFKAVTFMLPLFQMLPAMS